VRIINTDITTVRFPLKVFRPKLTLLFCQIGAAANFPGGFVLYLRNVSSFVELDGVYECISGSPTCWPNYSVPCRVFHDMICNGCNSSAIYLNNLNVVRMNQLRLENITSGQNPTFYVVGAANMTVTNSIIRNNVAQILSMGYFFNVEQLSWRNVSWIRNTAQNYASTVKTFLWLVKTLIQIIIFRCH